MEKCSCGLAHYELQPAGNALSAMDLRLRVMNPQDALTGTCNLSRFPALLVSPRRCSFARGAIVAKTMAITSDQKKRF
jgi:hypothetical protein